MPRDPLQRAPGVWKRFLLGSALIVVLMTAATATAVLMEVKHVSDLLGPAQLHLGRDVITPEQAGAPETILVIGTDRRPQSKTLADRLNPPHSDTLLLVRMDPRKNQTSVLSVPRDLRTTIDAGPKGTTLQKINAAYTIGGAPLAAKTIERALPGITIQHVIDINFKGFRRVIDAIGCVYVYVDRHYYNQNVGTALTNYASIDIQPGYQRLCDQTALDYARYRHTDSDFVRVARQQDFLRQAKQQIGVSGLLDHEDRLLRALRQSVQTDIHGTATIFHLFTLAAFSLGRPVRQVKFQADQNVLIHGGSYVIASPVQVGATVSDFIHGNPPAKVHVPAFNLKRSTGAGTVRGLGLTPTPEADVGLANVASVGLPIKLFVPRLRLQSGPTPDLVRAYTLRDERGVRHRAYVISISRGLVGEYYGIEGTDWKAPPILAGPHGSRKIAGRTYDVYIEGSHIRTVAWHLPHAVYWLNNTLDSLLTNRQMLAIAESARPVN
ncbi:MAG: polyisoprenyl-teichoic acid--peptidoglycan teichoic acid transferase [Solirubrobacteraceae bacterium]|nr:polyisoprenyl-teichoic acid--peptidoglycan teichoic acid transferase [Solirubrobacteraceae bacterium]MEA2353903.1 polyisoprenyl-teichoic acid--peptidoglycan teichoic acid transferase [Solirubrobacteraceae bacterium]